MSTFLQTVLTAGAALGAVLGIILLAGRGARVLRLARPEVGRRLALREALALDRTRRLVLVSCDGRDLLLLTGGGVQRIKLWPGFRPLLTCSQDLQHEAFVAADRL